MKRDTYVIGDTAPIGICGIGIIDAVTSLLEIGQMDECGALEDASALICGTIGIAQKDIRMVQLAKSAIRTGKEILVGTEDLTMEDISTRYSAGGFGSFLDVDKAVKNGLVSLTLAEKTVILGNAALTGVAILLRDRERFKTSATIDATASYAELGHNPLFIDSYMDHMLF